MDFYWHYSSKEVIDQSGKDNFYKAINVAKQVFTKNSLLNFPKFRQLFYLTFFWMKKKNKPFSKIFLVFLLLEKIFFWKSGVQHIDGIDWRSLFYESTSVGSFTSVGRIRRFYVSVHSHAGQALQEFFTVRPFTRIAWFVKRDDYYDVINAWEECYEWNDWQTNGWHSCWVCSQCWGFIS